jgi:hypothetical protein
VALGAIVGRTPQVDATLTEADKAHMASFLNAGRTVIANTQTLTSKSDAVAGTGLVFAHSYTVTGVGVDARGSFVDLRNPWGVDGTSSTMAGLSAADQAYFTQGNPNDGNVRVSWATFQRAFATKVAA